MEIHVLQVVDVALAKKVLTQDWAKRTGAYMREEIGGKKGPFLIVSGDPAPFLRTGAFERVENEEELVKVVERENEDVAAGVSLLGV